MKPNFHFMRLYESLELTEFQANFLNLELPPAFKRENKLGKLKNVQVKTNNVVTGVRKRNQSSIFRVFLHDLFTHQQISEGKMSSNL